MYIPKIDFSKNVVWQIANPCYILKLWKILRAYYPCHTSKPNPNRPQNRPMIDEILSIRVNTFFRSVYVRSSVGLVVWVGYTNMYHRLTTQKRPIWGLSFCLFGLRSVWCRSSSVPGLYLSHPTKTKSYPTFDHQNLGILKYCFLTRSQILSIYQPSTISKPCPPRFGMCECDNDI